MELRGGILYFTTDKSLIFREVGGGGIFSFWIDQLMETSLSWSRDSQGVMVGGNIIVRYFNFMNGKARSKHDVNKKQ